MSAGCRSLEVAPPRRESTRAGEDRRFWNQRRRRDGSPRVHRDREDGVAVGRHRERV